MKKILFNMKAMGAIALSSLIMFSCVEEGIDISGKGKSRIRLNSTDGLGTALFDDFNAPGATLINVWRDAVSPSDLDKSITVEFEVDDQIIVDYNTEKLAEDPDFVGFEVLPTDLYDLVGSSITFEKGDFNKPLQINLTANDVDLTIAYAIGIRLKNPSGGYEFSSGKSEAVVQIVFKNRYDGVYSANGTMVDVASATLSGYYPLTWDLVTTGGQQVTVFDNVYLGIPGHIIWTGTGLSYYGSYGLIVNFVQATGEIASIVNYYGQPAGNSRSAGLDPSGVNAFDPDTKTITVKYYMYMPSVVTTPPHIRVYFDEVWTYAGAR